MSVSLPRLNRIEANEARSGWAGFSAGRRVRANVLRAAFWALMFSVGAIVGGCGQDSSGNSPHMQDADDEECADECINGSCEDGACLCETGYTGPTCNACAPEYQALDNEGRCSPRCSVAELDCGDNEVCEDSDGTATCVCDVGYTGPDCASCAEGFVDEGQGCRGEPMTVWDETTDPAPIYVPDDAPPLVLEAANDLADYLARSSGKEKPPVIEQDATAEVPQRSIKVGYPNDLTERDEIQIESLPGGPLSLTGVDVFDPENPDWVGQETEYNFMNQAGTHNAVMTFLHDYIGVVWGWPGALGEAVPSRAELKIEPVRKTHTPSALIRNCMGFSEVGNSSGYGISKELQKRNRNFYSLKVNRGHEMRDLYDDFHPDVNDDKTEDWMFALQPDGTRSGYPYGRLAKAEIGDPRFDDFFISWIVEGSLAENPLKESFSCSMNDGSRSGHSTDPRALAMDYDGPDAVYFNFNYEDRSLRAPTITDREVHFANRLTAKIRQTYPDAFVLTSAYGPTRQAPKAAVPIDGVLIKNVSNEFSNPNATAWNGNTHAENFDEWLDVYPRNQIWRPNLGTGYAHTRGMYLTQVHRVGERFKELVAKGVTGFTPDAFWEHYSTQWPMYYVMNQLLWDHTQDVDEIMNKAYDTLFGPASPHIKAYYEHTESVIDANPAHSLSIIATGKLWNDDVLDVLQGHLDSALASVDAGTQEHLRVEWVQAGLDWAKAVSQAVKYHIEYYAPAVVVDETNLAANANAIESDVDGNAGWTGRAGGDAPSAQSAVTNGSDFAFELDAMNGPGPHYIVTREDLPDGNLDSGTATSGDSDTLTDTSKSFSADQHAGRALRITGGANSGEVRFIVSNTEDTITVDSDFTNAIDGTTEYEITAMYLVSVDLRHSGQGGQWSVTLNGSANRVLRVDPEDTEWRTGSFKAYGGDTLEIRETNENDDGKIYVDNFKIQLAEPVDQEAIATAWNAHNNAAIAEIEDTKWNNSENGNSRPVGHSATRKSSTRMPWPGYTDSGTADIGFE